MVKRAAGSKGARKRSKKDVEHVGEDEAAGFFLLDDDDRKQQESEDEEEQQQETAEQKRVRLGGERKRDADGL
jgi:hypothetical protein